MASSQADIFLSPNERRDFALVVEGKRVYVDRENLTAWSPVFQAIFFPEDSEQPKSGMQMKGKKLQDFLHFLHYICPTTPYSKKITESNVVALLAYADDYSVAVMRDHCVAYLTEQLDKETLADDTHVEYLRLASLYRLVDVQKQLIPLVAQLFLHQIAAGDGDYQKSSCCEENVCVQLKCKHQPAGAAPNIVGFSDDLLEEKKA